MKKIVLAWKQLKAWAKLNINPNRLIQQYETNRIATFLLDTFRQPLPGDPKKVINDWFIVELRSWTEQQLECEIDKDIFKDALAQTGWKTILRKSPYNSQDFNAIPLVFKNPVK